MKLEFKESQKFSQWWLWLILLISEGFMIYKIYQQMVLGVQDGNIPMSNGLLILLAILFFALIVLFGMMRLNTRIDQNDIQINFIPFVNRKLNWKEVKKAEVVNYGFIGGWGFRFWNKYGTVYNTTGNMGLALELENGEKLMVGTQKEAELSEFLRSIEMMK